MSVALSDEPEIELTMTNLNRSWFRMLAKRLWRGLIQSGCILCATAFSFSKGKCMRYWLMKSEPDEMSIDDALSQKVIAWFGVRNYQARNFMRDQMQVGDGVLFYHSSCAQPGIAGIAEVASTAYPDPSQFDPNSAYFDPKAQLFEPRWLQIDIRALRKTKLITLADLRSQPDLLDMQVLKKGNRLSITPISRDEWAIILKMIDV